MSLPVVPSMRERKLSAAMAVRRSISSMFFRASSI